MNIDTQPIALTGLNTRRRRVLGLTAGGGAALAGIALAGRSTAVAKAEGDTPLVGSWMVAGIPTGTPPGPPRILVSFTGDGVAMRARLA